MNSTAYKPVRLSIFYCSNSFDAGTLGRRLAAEKGDEYTMISLPCSGKADLLYLLKAFEKGADGLVLITCGKNECRYLEGNLRAPRRAEQVNLILGEAGFADGRVMVINTGGDAELTAAKVDEFRDAIRGMVSAHLGVAHAKRSAGASCAARD